MKIKNIVLILIIFCNINIVNATIQNPSFEIDDFGWVKHPVYLYTQSTGMYAYGSVDESNTYVTDGYQSMHLYSRISATQAGHYTQATSQTTCSQYIDFTYIENIEFDMQHNVNIYGLHPVSGYVSLEIKINNTQIWYNYTPTNSNIVHETLYLNQFIDTTNFSGYQNLTIINKVRSNQNYNTRSYQSDVYLDNFKETYNPNIISPNSTETNYTVEFNDLFNDLTVWGFLIVIFSAFENKCGNDLFWLIIIMIPFSMTWIKQRSVIIPSILALVCGSVLFMLIPITAIAPVKILLTVGIAGIFYHIIKSR